MKQIRGIIFQTSVLEKVTLHDGTPAFIVNEKTQLIQKYTDFKFMKKVVSYLITTAIMDDFDYYPVIRIAIVDKNHLEKEYLQYRLDTIVDKYEVQEWREHGRTYETVEVKAGLKDLHIDTWNIIEDLKQYLIN